MLARDFVMSRLHQLRVAAVALLLVGAGCASPLASVDAASEQLLGVPTPCTGLLESAVDFAAVSGVSPSQDDPTTAPRIVVAFDAEGTALCVDRLEAVEAELEIRGRDLEAESLHESYEVFESEKFEDAWREDLDGQALVAGDPTPQPSTDESAGDDSTPMSTDGQSEDASSADLSAGDPTPQPSTDESDLEDGGDPTPQPS
jgi:hypothetical protein